MGLYWRLKDIPELREVPSADRRRKWREAVSRSYTARGVLANFLLLGLGVIGGDLLARWSGHAVDWINGLSMVVGGTLGGVLNDYALRQPRARRWLREHR